MIPPRHTEPELVQIGFAWLAASLLCAVAFPELQELRATLGSLVITLFAVAMLIGLAIITARAVGRWAEKEADEKPAERAERRPVGVNDLAVPVALLVLFLASLL